MNNLMKRDVNAIANRKGRGVIWDATSHHILAFAVLALLLTCGLGQPSAGASDFDLHWQDRETGDDLFVNFATGDYFFLNRGKQGFVAGKGKISVSDCAMELHDSGPNRKRPDREVHIVFNPCDNLVKADCEVFDSAERYAITDRTATSSPRDSGSAHAETPGAALPVRFDGFCLEDDSKDSTLSIGGASYVFTDRRKGISLQGVGRVVENGCKLKLTHDGADPKRPDRRVYAEINTCTHDGVASVWIAATGRTYLLHDSNLEDSSCKASAGN